MFSLSDLKQTKVYQEAKTEGILLLSVEQVAGAAGLEVALVERVAAGEEVEDIVREILG